MQGAGAPVDLGSPNGNDIPVPVQERLFLYNNVRERIGGALTLEKKLRLFLTMTLRAYKVPEAEVEQAIRFVEGLDIRATAERVMQTLFQALAMHYEFSLSEEAQAAAPAAPEDKEKKTKL